MAILKGGRCFICKKELANGVLGASARIGGNLRVRAHYACLRKSGTLSLKTYLAASATVPLMQRLKI